MHVQISSFVPISGGKAGFPSVAAAAVAAARLFWGMSSTVAEVSPSRRISRHEFALPAPAAFESKIARHSGLLCEARQVVPTAFGH